MTIVDSHCHLHFDAYDPDREAVIERARSAGVRHFIIIGTDEENNRKAHALASRYPFMSHTAGLHPHSAHEIDEAGLDSLEQKVAETKPCAIGEIGLDYFKSEAAPDVQKKVFRRMIRIAKKFSLPVVVHSRNAFDDTYEILRDEAGAHSGAPLRGVMHCFSYDEAALKKVIDLGMFASFACNVTYKNAAGLLQTLLKAPLGSVMLETDAPYLAPQTHRGQRNEPSHLRALVDFIAEKKGARPEDLARATTGNAVKLFGLPVTHEDL